MKPSIGIVDIGLGNISAIKGMVRALGFEGLSIVEKAQLKTVTHLILPGVGAFDRGVTLIEQSELRHEIDAFAAKGGFVLGICLGMQLLHEKSQEGKHRGLSLLTGNIESFRNSTDFPIPHVGWNKVENFHSNLIFKDCSENDRFYFNHSYALLRQTLNTNDVTTLYDIPFVSAVCKDNIYGVQFHPEKSHRSGARLLRNYFALK